ncbi:MAG: CRTAC1 family protein [Rhodobacterales bacterium]|nr:CRTAC1 family protein [Rhodobacterales bacterium]
MSFRTLACLLVVFTSPLHAQVRFENRAEVLGLSHQYTGGWEYFVGGGVAAFDCDGDFFPELFVAGGEAPAMLLRNTSNTRGAAVMFVSDTPKPLALTNVTGAYPFDFDNDGLLDLFVMRVGENKLLQGGADCSFTEFTTDGLDQSARWTTAFSATWEGENQRPTLAIGNYVDRNDPEGPFEACDENFLSRPTRTGYKTTPLLPAHCPLSMLFSDWNRQGRQDLRISNDRHYYVREGGEQLWALTPEPFLYSAKEGWKNYSIWGMGIASRDISGDGLPEIFLTSMGDQKLQMRDPDQNGPAYHDAAYGRGSTAHRPYTGGDGRPSTGWHIEFGDVDNDGRDDVFIAKGNVDQMPDSAMADPNNLLIQRPDSVFEEHGLVAGIATLTRSRGAALVDFNLDGALDLAVVNRNDNIEIYQNVTNGNGRWLLLDVRQTGANSGVVGGWIEVRDGEQIWAREITIGGGHASGSTTFAHFGLGDAKTVEIRMIWPDQSVSHWQKVATNQVLRISRDASALAINPL